MPANLSIVPTVPLPDLTKTSAEFVRDFVPGEYLIDGVLQRRLCYSITAQTGVGKTTVAMRISNGIDIAVATNSFRTVRGRPILVAMPISGAGARQC